MSKDETTAALQLSTHDLSTEQVLARGERRREDNAVLACTPVISTYIRSEDG